MSDFFAELDEFTEREVKQGLTRLVKRIAIDLHDRVIEKTPVDRGQARANWTLSVGSPSSAVKEFEEELSTSPAEAAKIARASQAELSRLNDPFTPVFISNNLPYIGVLENGSSEQAPQGMVAVSLAEVEEIYREVK